MKNLSLQIAPADLCVDYTTNSSVGEVAGELRRSKFTDIPDTGLAEYADN
jgi:hypothetical protein